MAASAESLNVRLASVAYAFELWARQPTQVTGLTMPWIIGLGAAALALGILGNGLLLRAHPASPFRTAYPRSLE
jgi:hypothetical protein